MSTAYDVKYPKDMTQYSGTGTINWAESTIHSAVDCVETYARAETARFCTLDVRDRLRPGMEAQTVVISPDNACVWPKLFRPWQT